jgi:hypothetical protein
MTKEKREGFQTLKSCYQIGEKENGDKATPFATRMPRHFSLDNIYTL